MPKLVDVAVADQRHPLGRLALIGRGIDDVLVAVLVDGLLCCGGCGIALRALQPEGLEDAVIDREILLPVDQDAPAGPVDPVAAVDPQGIDGTDVLHDAIHRNGQAGVPEAPGERHQVTDRRRALPLSHVAWLLRPNP